MALTPEQLAQIEVQDAIEAKRREHEKEMATLRQVNEIAVIEAQKQLQLDVIKENTEKQKEISDKQNRLEFLRLAKETLLENARSKPVDSREVTAQDVENFAKVLENYINK